MEPGSEVEGPSVRRVLWIVNPGARRGSAPVDDALSALEAAGVERVTPEIRGQAGIAGAIRSHAGEVDAVIVGGGDGTMNAAAPGLVDTGLPLGILPLGTANDLARTLDIPLDPAAAVRVVLTGRRRRLDLGDVNGHPFFNVASIGFSAKLARELTAGAKRRWGAFGYATAAARLLSESRPFTVEIDHDGTTTVVKTIQVSVGNGRFYGGGMTVEGSAAPDDGRLDVYSLEVAHWAELVALAPSLRRGTHGRRKRVRAFGTTELTLRTRRAHEVNADGELVTTTPARFTIRRLAVEAFVPAA